jgi:putative transposase
MARISRAVAIGFPHQVTQRGNSRRGVSEKKHGYLLYTEWLVNYSRKYSLKIWAYRLGKGREGKYGRFS